MTDIEQTQLTTKELEAKVNEQSNEILKLKQEVKDLIKTFTDHQHTTTDGSKGIRGNIQLEDYQYFSVGDGILSGGTSGKGTNSEINYLYILNGKDKENKIGGTTKNTQLMLQSSPYSNLVAGTPLGDSFLHGMRPPIAGGSATIVSGTSTLTDNTQQFVINELVGAYLVVVVGTSVERFVIASNTTNSITITGTFTLNGSCSYNVFKAIYLGSTTFPWKRLYVTETDNGGIRFGTNTLLYVNGDHLYFIDTAGTPHTIV